MDFSPGDVVVITENAPYLYSRPGSIGTIIGELSQYRMSVQFVSGEHNPCLNYIGTHAWPIEKRYLSLKKHTPPLTIQDKICKKIKQLDTQYVNKQLQKGNKVCDAFHAIVS